MTILFVLLKFVIFIRKKCLVLLLLMVKVRKSKCFFGNICKTFQWISKEC